MTGHRPKLLVATTSAVTPWGIMRGQLDFLRRHGFDVVLTASPGPLLERTAAREGVRSVPVPMEREIDLGTDARALRQLVGVFRAERVDVSMVSTPKAGLLAGIAALLTRVPVRIYVLRGLRLETTRRAMRVLLWVLEWVAVHVATDVVVVSPSLLAEARRLRLLGGRRGVVLGWGASNGVDTDRLAPTVELAATARRTREGLEIPPDAFVFGFVGRLTTDKGVKELVDAFVGLAKARPDVWMLVVGPLEADADATRYLDELVSHPRVRATGWLDDPSEVYHAMDTLVLPTYREGFPNVVIEAAAAAVPVVTTTATGAVDSVVDGVTGLLVPPHDAPRLREAMAALADDPARARRLGAAGRDVAVERFSHEVVWDALLAYLDGVVTARLGSEVGRAATI